MDRGSEKLNDDSGDEQKIVPLAVERAQEPAPAPERHSRLYSLALTGMSLSAFVGITALVLSVGVGLPASWRRLVIAFVIAMAISFMACASTAVFAAARETYAGRRSGDPADD